MLFAELGLILVLMMFIFVLEIVQPGCSYKICFYKKKSVLNKVWGAEADVSYANNFCNHSVFKDAMPRAFLHKDLREASLPASFCRKLQETGTERYSIKKLFWKKLCGSMAFL